MRSILTAFFTGLLFLNNYAFSAELLVEAESFDFKYDINGLDYTGNVILYGKDNYNKSDRHDTGWVLDQQFMDQMGSPYLLAHGLAHPVADAKKIVRFPSKGKYYVWVRTFDWVGRWRDIADSPLKASGDAPGRFEVFVNSKALIPSAPGYTREKTAFGANGTDWQWNSGGVVEIENPEKVEIRLHDLTGFEGRCDAIFFTSDKGFVPPNKDPEMKRWRQALLGTQTPADHGNFDLVVVGGGVAGMCASLEAARSGLSVAFIQDRPVPGGNNSSEVRVHLLGSTKHEPYPRIGDITGEIVQLADEHYGPKNTANIYADDQNINLLKAQPNISLYFMCRVNELEKKGSRIIAVVAEHIQTAKRMRFAASNFVDSTGDACVGYLAGADYEMQLFDGEKESVHMGQSNLWNVIKTDSQKPFADCPWAFNLENNVIPFENKPDKLGGWQFESGFKRNPIDEGERMRDVNFRAMYGIWDSLKNDRKLYPLYELNWAAYVSGKRESRRLMGDHVLSYEDLKNGVVYKDGCVPITRDIDLHYPREAENAGLEGDEYFSYCTFEKYPNPYWIPYRCLYSRNIDNLFMAGRNISLSHQALGAPRVMRTGGMMGEVVGMSAFLCKKYNTNPRGVYTDHLEELLSLMKNENEYPKKHAGK